MRVAGLSIVPLIGAGMATVAAVACGLDSVGSRDAASGSNDASTLADVTTTGNGGGEGGGGGGDSGLDGGDGSVPAEAAPPPAPYTLRVTSGLIVLYEMEEGSGLTAHDSVALGTVLTIRDATKAVWKPHALTFTDYTTVDTGPAALTKAYATCKATDEVTLEAWIESALVNQDVHTRIATMATSNANLNFALGTDTTNGMWTAVQANQNLTPSAAKLTTALTHLVTTRTASDSTLRLYVNGVKVDQLAAAASMSAWANVPLYVGNGSEADRGWRGSLHLLAVYSRALTGAEIATNFAAGADP